MSMQTVTNSVIICTRNRASDTCCMLQSLQKQTIQPTEIIVIDSSDKQLIENGFFSDLFCQNQFLQSKLCYKHTKPGLTYQRNVGIQCASSDVIYFFDDDVVLEKEYLEQMQKIFTEQPNYAGGMGTIGNIKPPSWRFQLLRKLFLLQRIYASGQFTFSGMPTHAYGATQFKDVEALGGCCMAYRASVLNMHTFDEQFHGYAYMEDCDISRRISYKKPLFFNPAAKLYHYNSPENRDAVVTNRAMFMHNYSYLFFKNFYPRNRLKIVAYWWSVLGLFIEALLYRKTGYCKGYIQGLSIFYGACNNNKN